MLCYCCKTILKSHLYIYCITDEGRETETFCSIYITKVVHFRSIKYFLSYSPNPDREFFVILLVWYFLLVQETFSKLSIHEYITSPD